jgi:cellulose biosynthesis protein BcsQ
MHAIVLATKKGGSGKSTLAIGQRVGLIEADPHAFLLTKSLLAMGARYTDSAHS